MLSNLTETLHSSTKFKNKQIAKIWGLLLEKQKSGPKMWLPEGLENTPFKAAETFGCRPKKAWLFPKIFSCLAYKIIDFFKNPYSRNQAVCSTVVCSKTRFRSDRKEGRVSSSRTGRNYLCHAKQFCLLFACCNLSSAFFCLFSHALMMSEVKPDVKFCNNAYSRS